MNRVDLMMGHIGRLLPSMDYQSYATGGRDYLVKSAADLGVETGIENVLPTPARFSAMALSQGTTPEEFFKNYVNKLTTSFSERTARITAEARETPKAPILDWEYKSTGGAPYKRQKQWNPRTERWEPVGDWIRMEKPEKPEKIEKAEKAEKIEKAEKAPTYTERRLLAKSISEAEGDILANSADKDMSYQVDFFNQNANTSHIYLWREVKWGKDKWKKINLPVINGRQVKAKDVQDTAEKYSLSYEEVLKRINAKAPFLSKKKP